MILLISPIIQRQFQLASIYDNPFFRLLEFIIGVILSVATGRLHEVINKRIPYWAAWTLLIVLILFMVVGLTKADIAMGSQPRDFMLMNWIVLPAFIGLYLCIERLNITQKTGSKLLTYCSSLTFAYFLSQFFVWGASQYIATQLIGSDNNIIRIAVSFMLCAGVSIFLHECIEKPAKTCLLKKLL